MRVLTVVLVAFFAVLRPLPSLAQSPEDLVRWIYQSYSAEGVVGPRGFAYLATPTQRRTFLSGRMAAFFDANDTYGDDLAQACIDFAFDIPGQDYDADEILRTLNITSQRDQGKMDVAAEFMTFNTPAKIVYTFRVEDGVWRIDDVTGPGWRVSDIPCTPKFGTLAPTEDAASQFCYRTETDELRLTLRPDGQARFRFESWQANGHHCGGSGGALPVQGGWELLPAAGFEGCQLRIMSTPEGGWRLEDPEWGCKATMCGARAVVDGLTFALDSQVRCESLPAPNR